MNKSAKFWAFLADNAVLPGLVLVLVIGAAVNSSFLSFENITNVLRSASLIGCVSIGMTFVILCGSIDLSVSSVFALGGYFFIVLSGTSPALAILIPVLLGCLLGFVNGFLVVKLRIPPFVGTLAVMMFVRGLVLLLTNETTVKAPGELSPPLLFLGRGMLFGTLSVPLMFFIVFSLIAAFVLNKRPIGRAMYIVGGNADAARMMGVSAEKTIFTAHVVCGAMAAIGGIILASRVGSSYPLAGNGYELYAIASAVIGGAHLKGGIGKMSGTFFGTLIMGSFTNIFNMQRYLNPVWEHAVVGAILLTVVVVQSLSSRGAVKRG